MKKLIYFAAALAALTLAASCEMDVDKTIVGGEALAPVLQGVSDVVVDANNNKTEAVIFNWSAASFGAPVQVQYLLYMTREGGEYLLAKTFGTSASVDKSSINSGAVALGIDKNDTGTVSAYVKAELYQGDETVSSLTSQSNAISFAVTTFDAPKDFIFLPGLYNSWGDSNDVPAWRVWEVEGGKKVYRTLVELTENTATPGIAPLKLYMNGSWLGFNDGYSAKWADADYGDNDGNWGVPSTELINFIEVDINAKVANREAVSAVGMIGSFAGSDWTDDVLFTFNHTADNTGNVWEAGPVTFTSSDEFLIRLNKSWADDFKYGGATTSSLDIEGGLELEQSGSAANIKAPGDGSYIVKLYANRTPFVIVYEKQ